MHTGLLRLIHSSVDPKNYPGPHLNAPNPPRVEPLKPKVVRKTFDEPHLYDLNNDNDVCDDIRRPERDSVSVHLESKTLSRFSGRLESEAGK